MEFSECLHNRQTKSGAFRLVVDICPGLGKRLKDFINQLFINPDTGVNNINTKPPSLGKRHPNGNASLYRCVFNAIGNKVQKHLLKGPLVAHHNRNIRKAITGERNAFFFGQDPAHLYSIGDKPAQINRPFFQFIPSRLDL